MRTPSRALLLLIAPALVVIGLVAVYPVGRTLALSLMATDYGFADARFVGLANYADLLTDRAFRRAIVNTVSFTVAATAGELLLGLAFALIFQHRFPGRRVLVPALVVPFVLSTMVVCALWRSWFHFDFGFLNNSLRTLGLPGVPWLFGPDLALASIVLVDIWQTTPLVFLILLAGLQSIPEPVREAARLDAAGRWRLFFDIELPFLRRYLMLAALLRTIESFKLFDKVFALTGGGPGRATETLSMHVYRLGFRWFDVGLASAAAVVMLAIAGALALAYARRVLR
jgi:multiple sugar transport system permease protein